MTKRAGDFNQNWRVRIGLACVALCVAAFALVTFVDSRTSASGSDVPRRSAAASSFPLPRSSHLSLLAASEGQSSSAPDYSTFSHASARHAALACDSCHRRAADNSVVPRLPGHKACTECHLPQFITQNAPLCSICHMAVEGENPPVKSFPSLQSFNVKFDHAAHSAGAARPAQGCVACHQPNARRAAALSIPAGFNAHRACYTCHTPDARADGRDIASCATCHAIASRYTRTSTNSQAFSFAFSHATHGARQRLSCADCHRVQAGLPQSRQVTATRTAEHFASPNAQNCATCHDSRRAFGETNFADCRRCHRGSSFRSD